MSTSIAETLARFEATFPPQGDERSQFHSVYYRNTGAVERALTRGAFLDPGWVEEWDVVFAELYFEALEASSRGEQPSAPWRIAFGGARDPDVSPLVHVLVSMNAHINYDLPQSLITMMSGEALFDPDLVRRRQIDFERIDAILVQRVKEEDLELRKVSDPPTTTRGSTDSSPRSTGWPRSASSRRRAPRCGATLWSSPAPGGRGPTRTRNDSVSSRSSAVVRLKTCSDQARSS